MTSHSFARAPSTACLLVTLLFGSGLAGAADIEVPRALDERLKVELFAAEPDVATVTGLTVDALGRVYVVESHTHFRPENYTGPETDRIRLLEDTNGDGRADRILTFFSGTTYTMNVAAHPNGWIYVATRNQVFRLRDNNDAGVADERQDLISVETEADFPHNGLSGFAFDFAGDVYFGLGENSGLDAKLTGRASGSPTGDIYFALGQNSGVDARVVGSQGQSISVARGAGGIFRCQPDGSGLELVATGFWNPFHLCFDTYGRMFTGDNDPGNRPPCRFLSIVEGGNYGYVRRTLEPFIAVDGETPGSLPMTSSTGESPTGILAYEAGLFPADYLGRIFVASWGEHRIDSYQLEPSGAGFTAKTSAIVAGGESFRPAGMALAPDGSLFVGDWADRSYPLHGKGRVWRISIRDSSGDDSTRDDSTGQASAGKLSVQYPNQDTSIDEVIAGLQSLDRLRREAAAGELLHRGSEGFTHLCAALENSDSRVRSLALTALVSAKKFPAQRVQTILHDHHAAIREQAARTLPVEMVDLPQIIRTDKSSAVQAAALRRVTSAEEEPLLLERLRDADPLMQQAARHALGKSVTTARLIELTEAEPCETRLSAILLLRDPQFRELSLAEELTAHERDALITRALEDSDSQIRFAAVDWIGREQLEQFRQPLIDGLATRASTPELFEAHLAALALLDGVLKHWSMSTFGDWWVKRSGSQRYVAPLLDALNAPPEVLKQALRFLPPKHPSLTVERLHGLLDKGNLAVSIAVAQALCVHPDPAAHALLIELVEDTVEDDRLRCEAIVGLDPAQATDRSLLLRLASDPSPNVAQEALRGLRGVVADDEVRVALKRVENADGDTTELLARLLQPEVTTQRPEASQLDQWLELLEGPSDASAGQRVFFHPRGPGCARCHRIDGRGNAIGPSFVRMNGRLPLQRRQLVQAIVDPSQDIDPGYLPLTILTVDGQVASGIYYKHGNGIREIFDSRGEILKFKIDDIEQMSVSKLSIMPDGLGSNMTLQELRDVLAYLLEPPE